MCNLVQLRHFKLWFGDPSGIKGGYVTNVIHGSGWRAGVGGPNGRMRRQDPDIWVPSVAGSQGVVWFCHSEMEEIFVGGNTTWSECISMKDAHSARKYIYLYHSIPVLCR